MMNGLLNQDGRDYAQAIRTRLAEADRRVRGRFPVGTVGALV